jgi:hypothetical protein
MDSKTKIRFVLQCLKQIVETLNLSNETQEKIRDILFTESQEFREAIFSGLENTPNGVSSKSK